MLEVLIVQMVRPAESFELKVLIQSYHVYYITREIRAMKISSYIHYPPKHFIRHCITEKCRNDDIKCEGMRGVAWVACRSHYQSRDLVCSFPSFRCTFSTSNYPETDALRCLVHKSLDIFSSSCTIHVLRQIWNMKNYSLRNLTFVLKYLYRICKNDRNTRDRYSLGFITDSQSSPIIGELFIFYS